MKFILSGISVALFAFVVLYGSDAYAGERADVPEPAGSHTLTGETRTIKDGAVEEAPKKIKSLTRSLREYSPEPSEDDNEPGGEIFGVGNDRSIRYDERKTRKKHSAAGYEKTKEDFVDPKSVMTK